MNGLGRTITDQEEAIRLFRRIERAVPTGQRRIGVLQSIQLFAISSSIHVM